MSTAATTPVIVGTAQVVNAPSDKGLTERPGPVELIERAIRSALDDAGTHALVDRIGLVGVAGGVWRYSNMPQVLEERLGAPASRHVQASLSGSGPQELLAIAAEAIANGEVDVALVAGGEANWTWRRLRKAGIEPAWSTEPGVGEPEPAAAMGDGVGEDMRLLGGAPPWYALMDDRVRATAGRSVDAHRDRIASRWARFAEIAVDNPYAWDRSGPSMESIRDATPDNRMIAFPYTKAMVANNQVDMATCTILASEQVARELGVDDGKFVYPLVTVAGHETLRVAPRRELDEAPALALAGTRAFEHAGFGPADISHVDLYACFPSIVEISATALRLDDGRDLTVTGGLGFAASPLSNWVGHSISAVTECVRNGGNGLVHANGGIATKQSFAIYSQEPAADGFARLDIQDEVDLAERAVLPEHFSGSVTVDAATVVWDREGPQFVFAGVTTDGDDRGWARSSDPDLMAEAQTNGIAGLAATVDDGTLRLG